MRGSLHSTQNYETWKSFIYPYGKKIHWIESINFRAFHHHLKNQRTNLDLASNFGASKKQFNKSEGKND